MDHEDSLGLPAWVADMYLPDMCYSAPQAGNTDTLEDT